MTNPDPYGQQQPADPGGPPPQQPTQYPQQPYYPYPPPTRTNTMAILALVLSLVFFPAGVVMGHIARKQIRETGEDGDGLALAGLIIGYVQVGLWVAFCLFFVIWAVVAGVSIAGTTATAGAVTLL